MKAVHETIQPNGVCWDCGKDEARPVLKWRRFQRVATGISAAGWRCTCGRWWPVLPGDLAAWARALVRRLEAPLMGDSEQDFAALGALRALRNTEEP